MVFLFSLSTWYVASFPILFLAGVSVAGFAAMQGTLLMHGTPPEMRSRLMGLLTLSIGFAPLGILLVGALSEWLGPARTLTVTSPRRALPPSPPATFVWPGFRQASK